MFNLYPGAGISLRRRARVRGGRRWAPRGWAALRMRSRVSVIPGVPVPSRVPAAPDPTVGGVEAMNVSHRTLPTPPRVGGADPFDTSLSGLDISAIRATPPPTPAAVIASRLNSSRDEMMEQARNVFNNPAKEGRFGVSPRRASVVVVTPPSGSSAREPPRKRGGRKRSEEVVVVAPTTRMRSEDNVFKLRRVPTVTPTRAAQAYERGGSNQADDAFSQILKHVARTAKKGV